MFLIRSNGTLNSANTEKFSWLAGSINRTKNHLIKLTTLVYDIIRLYILDRLGDGPRRNARLLLDGRRRHIRCGERYCTLRRIRVRLAVLIAIIGALHIDNIQAISLLFRAIVRIDRHRVVVVVDNCAATRVHTVLHWRRLNVQMLLLLLAGIDDGRVVGKGQVCRVGRLRCDDRWRCDGDGRAHISTATATAARAHRVVVVRLRALIGLSFSSSFVRCEESHWT